MTDFIHGQGQELEKEYGNKQKEEQERGKGKVSGEEAKEAIRETAKKESRLEEQERGKVPQPKQVLQPKQVSKTKQVPDQQIRKEPRKESGEEAKEAKRETAKEAIRETAKEAISNTTREEPKLQEDKAEVRALKLDQALPEATPEVLPEALPEATPKVLPEALPVVLQLVLLRHGHTQWNRERRYLGSTDLPLLPEAREEMAGLKGQPELCGDFWRVYCSDLRRCRDTLVCIAPGLETSAIYDSRLREMSFGGWEGCTYEQLQHDPQYRSWIDDPVEVTPPDGESWQAFEARLDTFLHELRQEAEAAGNEDGLSLPLEGNSSHTIIPDHHQPNEEQLHLRVLLVTHGGVIRQLLARTSEDMTFRTAEAPLPGTAVVVTLTQTAGKW